MELHGLMYPQLPIHKAIDRGPINLTGDDLGPHPL